MASESKIKTIPLAEALRTVYKGLIEKQGKSATQANGIVSDMVNKSAELRMYHEIDKENNNIFHQLAKGA